MSLANNLLEQLLSKKNDEDREHLKQIYIQISPDEKQIIEPRLIALLSDEKIDNVTRSWVTSFLGLIGSPTAYNTLKELLPKETSELVRRWICRNLLTNFTGNDRIQTVLEQYDKENTFYMKSALIKHLDRLDWEDGILAVDKFIDILENDRYEYIRYEAARALGNLGSPEVVEPLIKALFSEESSYFLENIIESLGSIQDPRAIPALIKLLQDDEKGIKVQIAATRALSSLPDDSLPDDKKLADQILLTKICHPDRVLAFSATDALFWRAENLDEVSMQVVKFGLQYDEPELLRRVADALRYIGETAAIDHLKSINKDSDQATSAKILLEQIGGPQALEVLVNRRMETLNQVTKSVSEYDSRGQQIFKDTIDQAKRGFDLNLRMSSIIFIVGVVLLAISLVFIIIPETNQYQQLFGVGGSLAGLGTILTMFYYGPSDRINRAVTNLVQIEIAFLSFIRQVTQIMAMFEREYLEDDFSIDELKKLLDYIERTLKETMPLMHKYTLSDSSTQEGSGKQTSLNDEKKLAS